MPYSSIEIYKKKSIDYKTNFPRNNGARLPLPFVVFSGAKPRGPVYHQALNQSPNVCLVRYDRICNSIRDDRQNSMVRLSVHDPEYQMKACFTSENNKFVVTGMDRKTSEIEIEKIMFHTCDFPWLHASIFIKSENKDQYHNTSNQT
jgi:hypothetical protein